MLNLVREVVDGLACSNQDSKSNPLVRLNCILLKEQKRDLKTSVNCKWRHKTMWCNLKPGVYLWIFKMDESYFADPPPTSNSCWMPCSAFTVRSFKPGMTISNWLFTFWVALHKYTPKQKYASHHKLKSL